MKRGWKIALGTVAGLFLLIMVVLQAVLSPSFLTKMANKYAPRFLDADIAFGRIDADVFRSFPHLSLEVDDFTLTYPHDRFAAWDSVGIASRLREKGRSPEADTLASAKSLRAAVDILPMVRGRFRIPSVRLDGARIFAHKFDTLANWQIFGSSKDDDTTSSGMPKVILKEIALTGKPVVVYTDPSDTLFATVRLKELNFKGKVDLSDIMDHRLGLDVDSLFVAGRLPADTLAAGLDFLRLHQKREWYDIDASAKAFIAMRSLGRMMIPLGLKGRVSLPDGNFKAYSFRDLDLRAATIGLTGEGDVRMGSDSTYVRAELSVDDCPVEETLRYFAKNIMPKALRLKTDARISLTALCDGWYKPADKSLPELVAELVIPSSSIAYDGFDYKGRLAADIGAMTDRYGRLDVNANKMDVQLAGAHLSGTGSIEDVLGDDPLIGLDMKASASMDTLTDFLPDGISAKGDLKTALSGYLLLSDASLYNFSRADLEGFVRSGGITIDDVRDSLFAYLGKTDLKIGKAGEGALINPDRLAISGAIDSLHATYGPNIYVHGRGIDIQAENAEGLDSEEFGQEVHPVVASLGIRRLALFGSDSLFVGARGSRNRLKLSHRPDGDKTTPILAMSSNNGRIFVRQGVNRIGLRKASVSASAVMNGIGEKAAKRKHVLDSLQKVYPGVERDSLFRHAFRARMAGRVVPDYLREKDFRDSDIDISVNSSLAQYIRDWTLGGSLQIDSGNVVTPTYPIPISLAGLEGHFDNDAIRLNSARLRAGASDLSAQGRIYGLRRALLGRRGVIGAKLDVRSDRIDAMELMKAYNAGASYKENARQALNENISDEDYEAMVAAQADTNAPTKLMVIPANLDATLSLQGNEIDYSNLIVNWFASDIHIKQRTLQITNTVATSNMGDIYFEGFYSSRTKQDISAGFDLNMADITADEVITLAPKVDSLIPMLKNFKGNLDCELAATTQLDTNMNFITPTINGVMKIEGSDMSIVEEGAIKKITRLLMFRDQNVGHIADISVQGLINNNILEVFPFVLSVDRYTLAMSGLQNFDKNFNYHVSVLKSPIPFRFGVDLFGSFDSWKWKLTKARYKNTNVPVFTTALDNMQGNLVSSIHNVFSRGIDMVMQDNAAGSQSVQASKVAAGYNATAPSEDLDAASAHQLDSLQYAYEHPEQVQSSIDSLLNARMDAMTAGAELQDSAADPQAERKARQEAAKAEREARKADEKAFRESLKGLSCKEKAAARKERKAALAGNEE